MSTGGCPGFRVRCFGEQWNPCNEDRVFPGGTHHLAGGKLRAGCRGSTMHDDWTTSREILSCW